METEWINRNEWFEPNDSNDKGSFQEHHATSMRTFRQSHAGNLEAETLKEEPYEGHDARMRMFAQSHASGLKVKVSRRDLINMMWPLLVKGIEREAGGSTSATGTTDWSSLFPVGKVAPYKFSQN